MTGHESRGSVYGSLPACRSTPRSTSARAAYSSISSHRCRRSPDELGENTLRRSTLTPSPSPERRGEMYSAELANRTIPRELDGGGAGALIRPVFSIWRLSARCGPSPVPASWPRYAGLPLTYHPVPDIALSAVRKTPPRNSRGAGEGLPRFGGWNRLPGNSPLIPLKTRSDCRPILHKI